MFGKDDKQGRHDHHDGTEIKFRLVECRHGKPWRFFHGRQIDDAHEVRQDIAGHDADQDRDDADETPAEECRQNGDDESKGGNDHGRFIAHPLGIAEIA